MKQGAIDFSSDLNPQQLAAATAPDGAILVLAAAGTGKTRTLVYRVAHLVERGVSADRILLLTFTNRAAREMLERAERLVGPGVGGIWGGTFHHMANRILRRHAACIGFRSDFAILDRDDSRSLMRACIRERDLQGREFPKAEVLLSLAGRAANTRTALSTLIDERFSNYADDPALILAVIRAYQEKKVNQGAMDFDDLLVNGLRLLEENAPIRARYQEQFMHVLVDEYQDTNIIQSELVDCVAAKHGNVLVVGDDFQSIYSWRGADYRNIMSFPERYEGTQVHKLETNYRSVPEILAVANACIAGNPDQYQKTLRATREGHRRPRLARVRDGEAQARYIVAEVHRLRREGYRPADIAILYRAHYHAMELQMVLSHECMEYSITSGIRFFEQAHIKDVCCLLRIIVNPHDQMAFVRLLELLPGVGPRTTEKIWRKLGDRFDITDAGQRKLMRAGLPKKAQPAWAPVEGVLTGYLDDHLAEDGGEVIDRFMKAFYERYLADTYELHERRVDDLRELILFTTKFETIRDFLSDVALATNLDAEADGAPDADTLRLSTVHQAKGLEWPVVIVLWLTEGMFPSARSVTESEGEDSEERRLFYVAVTRARDELVLCVPEVRRARDGGVNYHSPSRFIDEIPTGLLEDEHVGFV